MMEEKDQGTLTINADAVLATLVELTLNFSRFAEVPQFANEFLDAVSSVLRFVQVESSTLDGVVTQITLKPTPRLLDLVERLGGR